MHATEAESEGLATFGGDIGSMLPMQRSTGGTSCEPAESNQIETSRGVTGCGTVASRFPFWAGREQAEGGYHHETYDA